MPPSVKFVEPVQTARGSPSSTRTMNLLWEMALLVLPRDHQSADSGRLDRLLGLLERPPLAPVVDDLDVGAGCRRLAERLEHRRPAELVDRRPEGEARAARLADEGEDRLLEPAREPAVGGLLLRRIAGEVGRRQVAELAGVGLAARHAAVEVDRVAALHGVGGRDLDRHLRTHLQVGRAAVEGMDGVGVAVVRLGGVVAPVEGLDRVLHGAHEAPRRRVGFGRLEGAEALQPVRLVLGVVPPVDGEAEEALALGRRDVETQEDDERSGDRLDRDAGMLLPFSHDALLAVVM